MWPAWMTAPLLQSSHCRPSPSGSRPYLIKGLTLRSLVGQPCQVFLSSSRRVGYNRFKYVKDFTVSTNLKVLWLEGMWTIFESLLITDEETKGPGRAGPPRHLQLPSILVSACPSWALIMAASKSHHAARVFSSGCCYHLFSTCLSKHVVFFPGHLPLFLS